MRSSIPEFSKVIAPFQAILTDCYGKTRKRTQKSLSKIDIADKWGSIQNAAFLKLKQHLIDSGKLSYFKDGNVMCLYTDASEYHWEGILTQVPQEDMHVSYEQRRHDPLGFLSGSFTGSLESWSIVEEKAYAVVESLTRRDYIVSGHQLTIFIDHMNLVDIFDPYGQTPTIARHAASKLLR